MPVLTKQQSEFWIAGLKAVKNEERFRMHYWFTTDYVGSSGGSRYHCGTAACFGGHLTLIEKNLTEQFFGINGKDYDEFRAEFSEELRIDAFDLYYKLGVRPSAGLFFTDRWERDAYTAYERGRKFEGLVMQIKHIFQTQELQIHPECAKEFFDLVCIIKKETTTVHQQL